MFDRIDVDLTDVLVFLGVVIGMLTLGATIVLTANSVATNDRKEVVAKTEVCKALDDPNQILLCVDAL